MREAFAVAEADDGKSVVRSLLLQVWRSGPLPTPEEMAGYRNVSADFPDRIMRMAESAIEAEREDRRAFRAQEARASNNALAAVLALIATGGFIAFFDPVAGAGVITATVIGLAGVFLGRKWIENRKALPGGSESDDHK